MERILPIRNGFDGYYIKLIFDVTPFISFSFCVFMLDLRVITFSVRKGVAKD